MKKRSKGITRRDFMKKVGYTAGAITVGSALPGFITSSRAAARDHILIGRPLPKSGPVAAFTQSTPWLDDKAVAEINKDGGIFIKEAGKKLPVKVVILDTESNPTKGAELASRLIMMDKVDIMYVSATPATVSPVAAVCERQKMPCVSTMMPNEMFLLGGPYQWCFNASVNVSDFLASFIQAWDQVETNKVVGLCAQNDADGVAWAQGAGGALKARGYTMIDLGRFPEGTNDYTTQISGWKKEKVEILFSNMAPPDFAALWRQCFQAGFVPKVSTAGRAGLFSAAMEAIGQDLGLGVSSELMFHPEYPYKSSLSGETGKQICDAYEKASGKQWNQPIGGCYAGYEIVADALKRAGSLDKEAIRKALAATQLETLQGPTKFGPNNVAVTPSGCVQWVKGDKFPFRAAMVANGNYKSLPVKEKLISIPEIRQKAK